MNTIILTVHNKENSIVKILINLIKHSSNYTSKIIIIIDGCTDNTHSKIKNFLKRQNLRLEIEIIVTDDIWETKANNIGLRMVKTEFASIVQDDMLIIHRNWDKYLIDKFKINNLFSISGRAAHDFKFISKVLIIDNLVGREYPLSNKGFIGKLIGKFMSLFKPYWIYKYFSFFSKRIVANRGPLILKMKYASDLDFFDECFAPFELDDLDLCYRAYKKYGLLSGSLPIYYREIDGSKKNNLFSKMQSEKSIIKNTKILIARYPELSK